MDQGAEQSTLRAMAARLHPDAWEWGRIVGPVILAAGTAFAGDAGCHAAEDAITDVPGHEAKVGNADHLDPAAYEPYQLRLLDDGWGPLVEVFSVKWPNHATAFEARPTFGGRSEVSWWHDYHTAQGTIIRTKLSIDFQGTEDEFLELTVAADEGEDADAQTRIDELIHAANQVSIHELDRNEKPIRGVAYTRSVRGLEARLLTPAAGLEETKLPASPKDDEAYIRNNSLATAATTATANLLEEISVSG